MTHTISCSWNKEMSFSASVDGHTITLDADPESGGKDRGPRPKKLVLTALAGCTGMDVIYILNKMKIVPAYFNIDVEGDLGEENPKSYTNVRVRFQFAESDRQYEDSISKAVKLSQDKYCGVAAQLKAGADVSYEIEYLENTSG